MGHPVTQLKLYQNLLLHLVQLVPDIEQVAHAVLHFWQVTKSLNKKVPSMQLNWHLLST